MGTSALDRPSAEPRALVSWAAPYGAIVLDVVQVFALVYSDGFTRPRLVTAALVAFTVDRLLLAVAPVKAIALLAVVTGAVPLNTEPTTPKVTR